MKTYSTWAYYQDTYYGKLSEAEYERHARMAHAYIVRVTYRQSEKYKRVPGVLDQLQWAECALADKMKEYADTYEQLPEGLGSINNDGFSVSRTSGNSTNSTSTPEDAYMRICKLYLSYPVNLLYRGVPYAHFRC